MKVDSFILIIICAIITYLLRFGGLMLADKLPEKGKFKRALNILPAAILLSYVTPDIIKEGIPGAIAAIVIIISTRFSGKVLLSTTLGVITLTLIKYLN